MWMISTSDREELPSQSEPITRSTEIRSRRDPPRARFAVAGCVAGDRGGDACAVGDEPHVALERRPPTTFDLRHRSTAAARRMASFDR